MPVSREVKLCGVVMSPLKLLSHAPTKNEGRERQGVRDIAWVEDGWVPTSALVKTS